MSDDLVRAARATYAPPYVGSDKLQPLTHVLADHIEAQAAEITHLRARIVKLEEALDASGRVLHKAGEQFSEYAKQHAAKSTAVSDLKADFNKQWAERCFSAYRRAVEGGKDE